MNQLKKKFIKLKDNLISIFYQAIRWLDSGKKTTPIFLAPYVTMFFIFIVIPVVLAMLLSFTYFNGIQSPKIIGLTNYIYLLTQDEVFMKTVIPNTILFSVVVGPGGYALSFFVAWMLSQIPHKPRTIMALIIYSPSLTSGVAVSVLWKIIFSGEEQGILNAFLLKNNFIIEPIQWLQSPDYLMPIMIVVTLWSSMGVGFLAILAGLLNVNKELYEAAYVDGMKSRFQEIVHITIPSIKREMLFSAVMNIVGTFTAGGIGVTLSGANPTPQNAGQLVINHIDDYGVLRSELGMASAISVILLIMILFFSKIFQKIFGHND